MPGLSATASVLSTVAQTQAADWVDALAFSPTGDMVAAAAADGSIMVLGLDGATRIAARHEHAATTVAFSCSGQLASGGQDGQIAIDGVLQKIASEWVARVAWRPDGALLAVAHGRRVSTYDAGGAHQATSGELPATVACLGWHPRGVQLAAGTYGGVQLLRGNGLARDGLLAWKGSVLELAISPNGRRLAHGNQDASVHFWDLRKRPELEMWGYARKVRQLAWRHDARYLATGGGDEVTLWDFAGRGPEGTRPITLQGHDEPLAWLGFAPASRRLASVAGDGRALLWLPGETVQPLGAFELGEPLTCGAWSHDGRLLAVGSAGGAIAIIDADPAT
jgi:WD40 repeat protein